ncbi:MAG TPA: hypothetical protein VK578_10125 [Edaphobacter sp.]|nr:hypothetical protein [Edaphobacter sp.]
MEQAFEHTEKLMREIRIAQTKEEARAVAEAAAQWYLEKTPWVSIDIWRQQALELIGYMTGTLGRDEANRILDLFETEHPWRDRAGNMLPVQRQQGESRRRRSFAVLKPLIHSCRTRAQAAALVDEEVDNMVADDPRLSREQWRNIMLDSIRFDIRYTKSVEEGLRLSEVFG